MLCAGSVSETGVLDLDAETDVEMMIAAHARTSANANEVRTSAVSGGVDARAQFIEVNLLYRT